MVVRQAIPLREANLDGLFWGSLQPKRVPAWVSLSRLVQDVSLLASKLPWDIACVAGIPRSGMFPASVLSTLLHLPLAQLTANGIEPLAHGNRGFAHGKGRTLIVDDSVYSGFAMKRAKELLGTGKDYLYAAVYVKPPNQRVVDFYACELDAISHLFEWNFFNNPWILQGGVAFDFDGILCHDPDVPDADEGESLERYRQWMLRARPRWLVRAWSIPLIVTARLERFRPETEAWLERFGMTCDQLVMHPADKASERGNVAAFKAEHYRNSSTAFFVESDAVQAAEIHRLTGKQVICPDVSRVWR